MKVCVITPTWRRHHLLLNRCIPSVAAQTYHDVTHIVVSDGPDPELRTCMSDVNAMYAEVDEHRDSTSDEPNVGAIARNLGLSLVPSEAELVAYLDDDNAFRPHHIARLVPEMVKSKADFGYSQMLRHGIGDIVGADPPNHGLIDSSILIQRADTHLKYGSWPSPASYSVDWDLVHMWISKGATWVHVPEITVDYYWRGTS